MIYLPFTLDEGPLMEVQLVFMSKKDSRKRLFTAALGLVLLFFAWPSKAQVTIRIVQLPENTPHDAALYLAGSFNDWDPGNEAYRLQRQSDGSYVFTLPAGQDSFEYKITRGNWSSVEGRPNGQAIPNRLYMNDSGRPTTEVISIASWEDLAGGPFTYYTFFLLLSAFQGILLVLAINSVQDNNQKANFFLSIALTLISLGLLFRVSTYDRELFQAIPKLILLPETLLFLYGPMFLFYIRALLTNEDRTWRDRIWHILPFGVVILAYTPLWIMPDEEFKLKIVNREIHWVFALVGGLALVQNSWYLWRVFRVLRAYRHYTDKAHSFEQNLQYLNTVKYLAAACLGLWAFIYLYGAAGWVFDLNTQHEIELEVDILYVLFAFTTFVLGFFAINHPEIFKAPKVVEKYKDTPMEQGEMEMLKERLNYLMNEEKLFSKPDLTLSQLAARASTNTHTLSRVLNEGFEKSFYDYINAYRVREFTRMMLSGDNQNETYLAVALEVGFNSKTTFNRAFKKLTGSTPREYLRERQNVGVPETIGKN